MRLAIRARSADKAPLETPGNTRHTNPVEPGVVTVQDEWDVIVVGDSARGVRGAADAARAGQRVLLLTPRRLVPQAGLDDVVVAQGLVATISWDGGHGQVTTTEAEAFSASAVVFADALNPENYCSIF